MEILQESSMKLVGEIRKKSPLRLFWKNHFNHSSEGISLYAEENLRGINEGGLWNSYHLYSEELLEKK